MLNNDAVIIIFQYDNMLEELPHLAISTRSLPEKSRWSGIFAAMHAVIPVRQGASGVKSRIVPVAQ